jgi:hypothetical protein
MFANREDFLAICRDETLTRIIDSDAGVLNLALTTAESQAKDYLFQYYDTDQIFSAIGTDRHAYLVRCVVNIAAYIIHRRLPKSPFENGGQSLTVMEYKQTLDYLEKLRDNKAVADLPLRLKDDGTNVVRTRYGSAEPPRKHF